MKAATPGPLLVSAAGFGSIVIPLMRLVLIGPPGSGKGTQAKLLSQRLKLAHIGTGDMLRDAIRLRNAGRPQGPAFYGRRPASARRLGQPDYCGLFPQGRAAGKLRRGRLPTHVAPSDVIRAGLAATLSRLDAVVLLKVDDEEIVKRMSGRLVCSNSECGTPYHRIFKPPRVPGICDVCGSKLMQRSDDQGANRSQTLANIPRRLRRAFGLLPQIGTLARSERPGRHRNDLC